MNISYKMFRTIPCIEIKYTDEEANTLKERMQKLQLKEQETSNGFATGKCYMYYQDRQRNFKYWLNEKTQLIDDINSPLVHNGKINISPFRLIPNAQNIVRISLDKGMDILEFELFVQIMSNVYKTIMSGIIEEKKVKVEVLK